MSRSFVISIHALREESDLYNLFCTSFADIFQSTLSARRATLMSIKTADLVFGFQSTLSARRATKAYISKCGNPRFQSTLSARRATMDLFKFLYENKISIHALREESDLSLVYFTLDGVDFNPRSPRGERPNTIFCPARIPINFNPRSPRGERQITYDIPQHR